MSTNVEIFFSLILLVSPLVPIIFQEKKIIYKNSDLFIMFPNNLFMMVLLSFWTDFQIIFYKLYSNLLDFIKKMNIWTKFRLWS